MAIYSVFHLFLHLCIYLSLSLYPFFVHFQLFHHLSIEVCVNPSCPILGPQVSHPQPGRSGSPASQSSARRERNGKAIAALGACGACRRPLQRADPRPPRLGDVAPLRGRKTGEVMKVDQRPEGEDEDESWRKKHAIPARFCHLWPFHFRHFLCFQTARTQQGHVPGHLGDTELSRKENLGSAAWVPKLGVSLKHGCSCCMIRISEEKVSYQIFQ